MNNLGRYRDERGLTNRQVADELAALLGRPMSAGGVELWSKKPKPPGEWARVLGLEAEPEPEPGPSVEDFDPAPGEAPPLRPGVEPPTRPADGRMRPAPSMSVDYAFARDRIEKLYKMIGAGASMATRNDGFAKVADDNSGPIADAWVQAARSNTHVATVVSFMESGGPVGELVIAHVILVLGFVYVSGNGPDALDSIYGRKFGGYRDAAQRSGRVVTGDDGADDTYDDAASRNGGAHPVGEPATAPGG